MTQSEPREYENEAVQNTLLSSYCPPLIAEARRHQDEFLRDRFGGQRLRIADIGCGDGYHGSLFGPTCELYHGFEVSHAIAEIARSRWKKEGLTQATVFEEDAANASVEPANYDVAWCLYFTPGNFRERLDPLSLYTDGYLDANPAFISVFSRFFRGVRPSGSMWLTVYKDVPEAEAAQRDFYENTGQHVITTKGSRFVATKENFWSARWSQQSMLSNLSHCDVAPNRVEFHDLNSIAWLVQIDSGSHDS